MGILSTLAELFVPQTRSLDSFTDHPGLTEQLLRVQGLSASPWRAASVKAALGVPAIQRAVALISNSTGSLSMQGFRNGALMAESPRIIQRPDPFHTPREFFRDSAYQLATRGETVWWIGSRDNDGLAASVVIVPLAELTVEDNPRNRLFPIYTWGRFVSTRYSAARPDGDFVHVTYVQEPGTLRGVGPLQLCGAAVSVSVEAQEWAANFFAGDPSTTELKSLVNMTEEEATRLKSQWMESGNSNLPRVTDPTMEWKDHQVDPKSAQMTEARNHQDGEAARMFGIPGSLLEYSSPGSSLTYQNVEQEYTKFVRTCLSPNYLEPIEQAFTDLMPRSTVGRFNVEGLLRADIKTRFEVYEKAIGIFGPDEGAKYARQREGLIPGNVEAAPVPFSAPSATPNRLPALRSQADGFRCAGCHKKLAESAGAGTVIRCRCGTVNEGMGEQHDDLQVRTLTLLTAIAERQTVIHNHLPDVRIENPITIERGAIQVDAQEPPQVTNEIHVDAPDMSEVAASIAAIAERPLPDVNVEAPHVTVEPAQVTVNLPENRGDTRTLKHDKDGRITQIVTKPN